MVHSARDHHAAGSARSIMENRPPCGRRTL